MQLARFFLALSVLAFAMLATAQSSVTTTSTAGFGGASYSPGPQVGPSSYVGPSAAPSVPVSPTNTGPVGGAINAGERSSPMAFDGKVASLSLVGIIGAGAWMAARL